MEELGVRIYSAIRWQHRDCTTVVVPSVGQQTYLIHTHHSRQFPVGKEPVNYSGTTAVALQTSQLFYLNRLGTRDGCLTSHALCEVTLQSVK